MTNYTLQLTLDSDVLAWLWVALAWLWPGLPEPWPEAGKFWQCINILYIQGIQSLGKTTITYPDPSQHSTPNHPHPLLKTDSPNLLLLPHHHPVAH